MQSFTSDSLRMRNEENAVELRKQKRNQEHIKRRLKYTHSENAIDRLHAVFPAMSNEGLCEVDTMQYDYLKMLKWVIEHPNTESDLQDALQVLAIKMSRSKNLPTSSVVALGFVPLLVTLCNTANISLQIMVNSIQRDSAWILCNIAAGDHSHSAEVVSAGGDEVFINSISSDDTTLSIHGVWGAGNIAGDCVEFRDKLLDMNIAESLGMALEIAGRQESENLVQLITWAVKNLVRGKPPISILYLDRTLPMIVSLSRVSEHKVVKEALWAIVHILESDQGRVQTIINFGFLDVLIRCMNSERKSLNLPSCRAIGTVASGTFEQTQTLLNLKTLDPLSKLLSSESENVRKEAYWALSNLVASSEGQIKEVMAHGILSVALNGLIDIHNIVRDEALWVFSNLCSLAGPGLRLELIQIGILDFCRGFIGAQPRPLIVRARQNMLSILEKILSASDELNDYEQLHTVCNLFHETELFEELEKLCVHGNQAVSDTSMKLLKQYFDVEPPNLIDEELPETFVFT